MASARRVRRSGEPATTAQENRNVNRAGARILRLIGGDAPKRGGKGAKGGSRGSSAGGQ